MSAIECNADLDHQCDANDGEPCPKCVEWRAQEMRYWARQWAAASPAERDPERYEREMKDAGR